MESKNGLNINLSASGRAIRYLDVGCHSGNVHLGGEHPNGGLYVFVSRQLVDSLTQNNYINTRYQEIE
jgi:hypothetical protein